ncbi:hypothetical protein [Methylosinus sp. RM1]|uniref:hypothetical protein n=1 Tax=Methylosinus sp. RM1 TaxID=2583817 RepID=UPI00140BE9E9|nr:hypothetical protein [Methylosinus sp. RM1]
MALTAAQLARRKRMYQQLGVRVVGASLISAIIWFGLLKDREPSNWPPGDDYPNATQAISEAIKSKGVGTYDVLSLLGVSSPSAICLSVSGRDPRQLAIEQLEFSSKSLDADKVKPFVVEGVFSILVAGEGRFVIESIDKVLIDFEEEHENRCVSNPSSVSLLVTEHPTKSRFVHFRATLEIRAPSTAAE